MSHFVGRFQLCSACCLSAELAEYKTGYPGAILLRDTLFSLLAIPNAKWFEKIQAFHFREDGEFGWRTPTKPLRFEYIPNSYAHVVSSENPTVQAIVN